MFEAHKRLITKEAVETKEAANALASLEGIAGREEAKTEMCKRGNRSPIKRLSFTSSSDWPGEVREASHRRELVPIIKCVACNLELGNL